MSQLGVVKVGILKSCATSPAVPARLSTGAVETRPLQRGKCKDCGLETAPHESRPASITQRQYMHTAHCVKSQQANDPPSALQPSNTQPRSADLSRVNVRHHTQWHLSKVVRLSSAPLKLAFIPLIPYIDDRHASHGGIVSPPRLHHQDRRPETLQWAH